MSEKAITQAPDTRERYKQAFLFGLGTAVIIFLPFVIMDGGYFFFFGDFNVQQIPFYQLAHEAVRSGDIFWSWYTDLGANFIGSYSFYLLGSPFFWLTLIFPTWVVPYLMAPLLCLKFACASLTGYTFITRFVKNKSYALLGGLLYAFSGFSIYNIFFNHFHEAIVLFPLLLVGLEEFMEDGRKGLFAIAVFANALNNYFFFVGQVVFLIIYFVIRVTTGGYKLTLRRFAGLAVESVLGVGAACVLLIPSILAIISNPRVDNFPTGWGALLYHSVQRYPQILQSFFFPPEIPSSPNFFPDANVKWSSVAGWLPLIGMSGALAFMTNKKKQGHFLKKIIVTCLIFAMVPVLNSAFYAFNGSYYARWFYMPVLMLALATAITYDDEAPVIKGWQINTYVVLLIIIIIGFMPQEKDGETVFGLYAYADRFWAYCGIAFLCCVVLYLVYQHFYKTKSFPKIITLGTCITIAVCSVMFIGIGRGRTNHDREYILEKALGARDNWDLPADEDIQEQFYRVDVLNASNSSPMAMDNQAMYWHMPTIQTFHSIVPGSLMEFFPSVGVTRDVGSRPEPSHWGLRTLLSVKFLFVNNSSNPDEDGVEPFDHGMPGFEYMGYQNGMEVWRNLNYIPMGFTYDYYMTTISGGEDGNAPLGQYESLAESVRENAMLMAIALDEEQVHKYGHLLEQATYDALTSVSRDTLSQVAAERKASSAYYFSHDNQGFTARIRLESDNLVFFSVPYEKGWTATVNGQPVDVEKVNVGLMAVLAQAGDNEIRFEYHTPGLSIGLAITIICLILIVLYCLYYWWYAPKRKKAAPGHAEQDDASMGIIGGADGPTAIFIANGPKDSTAEIELGDMFAGGLPEDRPETDMPGPESRRRQNNPSEGE